MKTGQIKWYNSNVGLGFISPDEAGRDVLFSEKAIEGSNPDPLQPGEQVKYVAELTNDVPVATKVIRVS